MHRAKLLPKPVTLEQFTLGNGRVTHEPTGASFVRVGRSILSYDWCLAGHVPGALYDPAEIKDVAQKLLADAPKLAC